MSDDLDLVLDGLDTQTDVTVLADLLAEARATRKEWHTAEQTIETRLAEVAGVGDHLDTGGRTFRVRAGSKTDQWDSDALRRLVVARGRDIRQVDPDTGEVLESEGEAVGRACFAALGRTPNWTVGGLKDLGIDADEHRTKVFGRRTVELL